jgi:hypothetical protein
VANTALLNRNSALSVDPRQRAKELQDESALLIAKSQALRLLAGELINHSQRMRVGAQRMQIFRWGGREALSELYCQKFEMIEAAARYKSNLNDGYPDVE